MKALIFRNGSSDPALSVQLRKGAWEVLAGTDESALRLVDRINSSRSPGFSGGITDEEGGEVMTTTVEDKPMAENLPALQDFLLEQGYYMEAEE